MSKLHYLPIIVLLSFLLTACSDEKEKKDKEEIIEMTILPETGFGSAVLSDMWTEVLRFKEGDQDEVKLMTNIITEGFDFGYRKGYEYKLKVKKVSMGNPPQDVSSVKYVFIEKLSEKKVITGDMHLGGKLTVYAGTIKFMPSYPIFYEEDGQTPKLFDALHARDDKTGDHLALIEIEGFNPLEGYEYVLEVQKIITADPYSISYKLISISSEKRP